MKCQELGYKDENDLLFRILQDPDLLQDVDPDPGSEKKIVKNSHKNQPKL